MKPPCVRNLERFKEKGCPEKCWDGEEGCPAWIEMIVSKRNNPQEKVLEKMCVDFWQHKFQWALLGATEGVQGAVESHRNASCTPDPNDPFNDNKAFPKPDPYTIKLVQILQEEKKSREAVIEYKVRELLADEERKQIEG
jgi:hypothetical protein